MKLLTEICHRLLPPEIVHRLLRRLLRLDCRLLLGPIRDEFDNKRQWQGAVQQWEHAHQEAETMHNIPPTALQRKLALRGAGEEEIAAWYAAPPLAQRNWAMHCGLHGLFGYSQDTRVIGVLGLTMPQGSPGIPG
jgi:hypothetical protein